MLMLGKIRKYRLAKRTLKNTKNFCRVCNNHSLVIGMHLSRSFSLDNLIKRGLLKGYWGVPWWFSGDWLHTSNTGGLSSIPGWGSPASHVVWSKKNKVQKGYWFPKFYQLLYMSSNPKSLADGWPFILWDCHGPISIM